MNGRSLWRSFQNALRGIATAFRTERNFRIHSLAAGLVVIVVFALPFELWERFALLLVTVLVLVLELANSSLERLVDLAKPRLHEYAGEVKDLMAASVLIASVFALCVGIFIAGPRVIDVVFSL